MLNIALCDDMPVFRDMLEMLIHEYETEHNIKFNLYQFGSGEELLEKHHENKAFFNLFFLDYHMKKLTGFDTAMQIRSYDKKCRIVFVTSTINKYGLSLAKPMKIINKPVERNEIFGILNEIVSCS